MAVAAAGAVAYLIAVAWLLWWLLVAAVVPAWSPAVITSGSMTPAIRTGDIVIMADVDPALPLGPGAVIMFDDPEGRRGLITHRITAVEPDGSYRTKGDANQSDDSRPVEPASVHGRGRLLVPLIGRPVVWAHHGDWLPLGAWIALTAAAWWCVRAWARGIPQASLSQATAPADPPRVERSVASPERTPAPAHPPPDPATTERSAPTGYRRDGWSLEPTGS